jgi:hypothetical protein
MFKDEIREILENLAYQIGKIYVIIVVGFVIFFGDCLALVISYTAWHSIPWAILHGICSWGYVIFYAIKSILGN